MMTLLIGFTKKIFYLKNVGEKLINLIDKQLNKQAQK